MYKNVQHYRHTVHLYLDAIWTVSSSKKKARTGMYNWLAIQMGLDPVETHVKNFTRDQCRQAIKILRPRYIQLYGSDLPWRKEKKMQLQPKCSCTFETAHLLPKKGNKYDGLYSRTYQLTVTVEGPQAGDYDMVIPFEELEEAIQYCVPDHKFIFYKEDPISTEIVKVLKKYDIPYLEFPNVVNSENLIKYLTKEINSYIKNVLKYKDINIKTLELSSVNGKYSITGIV